MNLKYDEVKEDNHILIRSKNLSTSSIQSNARKKKISSSHSSFLGYTLDDQNSTTIPTDSPHQKNYFLMTNQSSSKFAKNILTQDNSLSRRIEKIKQQIEKTNDPNYTKNIVQQRLDQLKKITSNHIQSIIQKRDGSLQEKLSQTSNAFYLENSQIKGRKQVHHRNKSDHNLTQNHIKTNYDTHILNSSTSHLYPYKSSKQQNNQQLNEDQINGDNIEGRSAILIQMKLKKRQEFCELFYENLYKDAERQYKSNSDKSKPVLQVLEHLCEKTIRVVQEIIEILGEAINVSKNSQLLDEKLNICINKAMNLKISYLMLVIQKLFGKICYEYNDYLKCIKFMKLCKNFSQYFSIPKFKISCYKYIGLSFKRLNKPKVSLQFFIKMLRQAWLLKEDDYELDAYDLIGMSYFHLGNIEKAQQYHQMMIDGIKGEEEVIKISNIMLKNRNYSNYPTLLSLRIKQESDITSQSNNHKNSKKTNILKNQYQLTNAEWNEYISSSEDEFDLPQAQTSQKYTKESNYESNSMIVPWNDRFIKAQIYKLQQVQDINYNKNPIGLIYKSSCTPIEQSSGPKPQLVIGPTSNQIYNQKMQNTYSSRFRISHTTPNRELFNYQAQVQQKPNEPLSLATQQSQMVDPIELSHHIKVVNKIKKAKNNLKQLQQELNIKLKDISNKISNQPNDQNSIYHEINRQNTASPQLIFSPSHISTHQNSFMVDQTPKLCLNQSTTQPNEKQNYFEQKQPQQRKNVFQDMSKRQISYSQQETKKQSPVNKPLQKQILQFLQNDQNKICIKLKNNDLFNQPNQQNKKNYFQTYRQGEKFFSNKIQQLQKEQQLPKREQNFLLFNQSRNNSLQREKNNV